MERWACFRHMHIPVLLKETLDNLQIQKGDRVVDATLGGGGFVKKVCESHGVGVSLIALDIDEDAVLRFKDTPGISNCKIIFKIANFSDIVQVLNEVGFDNVDKVFFDLGLSSFQIDRSGRGFSFQRDEPLKMTLSKDASREGVTAEEIVNSWSESVLKTIISSYGEERFAGRISKGIVEARKRKPLKTTFDLVEVIERSTPKGYRRRKIHPATKTFQALRMAVNDEITVLERGLEGAFEKLSNGGRMAVISFHSLEDRVVKRFFLKKEKEGEGFRVNKKPIRPEREEVESNRRSRSAKLRVLEKDRNFK